MLGLGTKLVTTPGFSNFLVVVEGSGEVLYEQVEFGFVFLADVSDGNDGSGLLVDQFAQSFLV